MITPSNEFFSALLAPCEVNSPVTAEFPSQRAVARSFDVFFDLRLNKRLSKQWRCRGFETPSRSFWRHCNGISTADRRWWPIYTDTSQIVEIRCLRPRGNTLPPQTDSLGLIDNTSFWWQGLIPIITWKQSVWSIERCRIEDFNTTVAILFCEDFGGSHYDSHPLQH